MQRLSNCRICLAEDVKLNLVMNRKLQMVYEKLTDMLFLTDDRRPIIACRPCFKLLKQSYQLQKKCLAAEKNFAQMLNNDQEETKPLINEEVLKYRSGSHKNIIDGCEAERLTPHEEVPAVCDGQPGVIGLKKEHQTDGVTLHHSESDLDDDVPLMEVKIEMEEENEASEYGQRVQETTGTTMRADDGVYERLGVFTEPKEEPLSDELEPDNYENSFIHVADIPPDHSESDLEDDVLLKEFKTELDIEQEVLTSTTVVKNTNQEVAITTERDNEEKSDNGLIRTVKKQTCETRYKCDVCQRSFSKMSALTKHKRIHTGEKPFKCELCQRRFIEKSGLTNHSRVHTGEKPFKCHICQKSFCQTSALKTHIRQHIGEKAFKCHLCQRSFSQKIVLANHIRIHTGEKPFKCNVCQCSFRQNSHLTTHIRQHTGEKPYKCDICQRSFNQKWDLTKHKRIHTGEKPYKCEWCERSFAQKSTLTTHTRIHTGEKPYKCDLCQRSFRDKRALTKHIC